jgi:hypothetical protein
MFLFIPKRFQFEQVISDSYSYSKLNGIGCNSWTSSIGKTTTIGGAIDLE